jgi:hypothetical protein
MDINIKQVMADMGRKINPATFKKGVISKLNTSNGTADVYFVENSQNIIKNIQFASNVDLTKITAGMRCRVDIFDETNPSDMVIAYTYGGAGKAGTRFASGTANVTSTTTTTIPHGLGVIPSFVGITKTQNPYYTTTYTVTGGGGGTVNNVQSEIGVYQYATADATNIYLRGTTSSVLSIQWFCIKF